MVIMIKIPPLLLAVLLVFAALPLQATQFNGVGDYQSDAYGFYYIITGGKLLNSSGGSFAFLSDDPDNGYTMDVWHNESWYPENSGFALTMANRGSIVFDNNGIENNTYGSYYDENLAGNDHGLYKGYSMSNNFDWIYASSFTLEQSTTIDTLVGYFDSNGSDSDPYPFDPASENIKYRMNIWSNVDGQLVPANTGGFSGDVFSSDNVGGSFSWSDTGVDRVFSDGTTDSIYRLVYTLDTPITLQQGVYWFSNDASLSFVPEPGSLVLIGSGLVLLGFLGLYKKNGKLSPVKIQRRRNDL
jgi:hypothetical protein